MSAHGTRARYSFGCRCEDCTDANRVYVNGWNAGRPKPKRTDDRLSLASPEMEWLDAAACVGQDSDLFFPETGQRDTAAKNICSACVVRSECLDFALKNKIWRGIWGGLNETERRSIHRRKLKTARERRAS